jgi:hypothetical protein
MNNFQILVVYMVANWKKNWELHMQEKVILYQKMSNL